MENPIAFDDPSRKRSAPGGLVPRPQYIEAPYSEIVEEQGPGLLLEYWDMVRKNAHSLVLAAFFGLFAALLFTLPQTPVYRARASLEIQNLNENFLNLRDVSPTTNEGGSSPPETDLQTQVQILQSESVLERVIARLNLTRQFAEEGGRGRITAWRKALGVSGTPAPPAREDLLGRIAKNLTVQAEPKTRLVEIFYNSPDPQLAAGFTNSLAAEFIQQNLEARWKTTQQTGEWLTRQMEDVRIKLEKSEDELQVYANASGLLFTSEKNNIAEEKLRQLQEELSRAQADRVAAQSKSEAAAMAPAESLPEVLDDKTLGEIQVKLTDLRRQLAELTATLTPAHPSVKKVQAQIAELELTVEAKRHDFVQRIGNEFQAAQRRENLLSRQYAAQAQLVTEQAAKVAHYNILRRDVDTNRELYDSMRRSVQEAGVSSALRASNVRVVDAAFPPTRRYKPSYGLNLALGFLAGSFFGLAFVIMRERADRSIQAPGQTEGSLGLPELGVIPAAAAERSRYFAYYRDAGRALPEPAGNGSGARGGESLPGSLTALCLDFTGNGRDRVELAAARRHSVLAESFRATLTSILFCGENGDRPRVIVLTSAGPAEGKTTVASNLALALAETGSPVLLIDGDLRKGRLHEIFHVSNAQGLADVLAAAEPAADAALDCRGELRSLRASSGFGSSRAIVDLPFTSGSLRLPLPGRLKVLETRYPRVFLLPSGPTPPSIAGLLYSPRTREVLQQARQEFHTVLIDSPPMLNLADARVLAKLADGVVLVVRAAQTTREAAAAAAERLREDGSRVLGAVLNEWDPRRSGYSGYAYAHPYYRFRDAS